MPSSSSSASSHLKHPPDADALPRALRYVAVGWLCVWLLLSVARQVFDLVGKLWLLVLVDLVQLLAILAGLFALLAHPVRPHLLRVLALFCALAVAHNAALLLWYCTDLLVPDHHQSDWLSFGLPFGHSFFLRHSPMCQAQFNLSSQRWEQQQPCAIPYSLLEGAQAVLHALMALVTLVLSVCVLLLLTCRRRGRRCSSAAEQHRRKQLQHRFVEEHIGGACAKSPELSSGYMDPSCYEDIFAAMPPQPIVPQSVTRRSYPRAGRRTSAGALANGGGRKGNLKRKAAPQAASMQASLGVPAGVMNHEHYSSLSTAGATDAGRAPAAIPTSTSSWQGTVASSTSSASSGGSALPPPRLYGTRTPYYTKLGDLPHRRAGSLRTFGASKDDASDADAERAPASVRNGDARSGVTALVSFDPKSATLIRVREHRRRASSSSTNASDADALAERMSRVEPSVPSSPAPARPPKLQPLQQQPLRHRVMPTPTPPATLRQINDVTIAGAYQGGTQAVQNAVDNFGISMMAAPPHDVNGFCVNGAAYQGTQPEQVGIDVTRHDVMPDTQQHLRQEQADTAAASMPNASIYEAYVGAARPLVNAAACTAFPVTRRALVDCSAASAIRLSRCDLDNDADAQQQHAASGQPPTTMLGMFV